MKKRICLSQHWIGDVVYHKASGKRGIVTAVQFRTALAVAVYHVAFTHNESEEVCSDVELSAEKIFSDTDGEEEAER